MKYIIKLLTLVFSFLTLKNTITIMTKQEKFDASLLRLDSVTNEIAADLKKLRDEIKNDDDVSDESLAKLDSHIDTLEGIGADPTDPAPDPNPPTDPPVDPNA